MTDLHGRQRQCANRLDPRAGTSESGQTRSFAAAEPHASFTLTSRHRHDNQVVVRHGATMLNCPALMMRMASTLAMTNIVRLRSRALVPLPRPILNGKLRRNLEAVST
jgi:hypothetical protein